MQCDVLRIYEDALTAKIFFKKNSIAAKRLRGNTPRD